MNQELKSVIEGLLKKGWTFMVQGGDEPYGYSYTVLVMPEYLRENGLKWLAEHGFEYDGYQDKCFEKIIRIKGDDEE